MKQPGVIVTLLAFIAALSFVLAAQQREGARPLVARLTGSGQLAGAVNGGGTAKILVNAAQSQLCYELAMSNVTEPRTLSILSNAKSKIVSFGLSSIDSAKGSSSQCAVLERDKLMDIARNPTAYTISIQTAEFPNGAIQGQLSK